MVNAQKRSYKQVRVRDLHVDPDMNAQRMFYSDWASKLRRKWDRNLLQPAIVSKRTDGKFYLIDGQHSTHVALEIEGPDFLRDCIVHAGLTIEQEARLFLAANRDRKPVHPYDTFRVAVTAGDPVARSANDEVRKLGLEVARSPSANRVGAVQTLLGLAGRRPGLVLTTLNIAECAWGRDATSWDNMMLRALGDVVCKNWDRIDTPRLVRVLEKMPVARWKANAMVASVDAGGGGSMSRARPLAENIVTAYNKRLVSEAKRLSLRAPETAAQ